VILQEVCRKQQEKQRRDMKRLVEFPLEEGGSIVIEIDEPETGGTGRAGREDKIEAAVARVQP